MMSKKLLWTQLQSQPGFEDVKILDLDVSRTTWSRVHDSMRIVYFKLSAAPPDLVWVRYFFEERESRVMLRRGGFWLEGAWISLDCLPKEIESHHMPDIQQSVAYANRKYREHLETRRAEQERAHHAERKDLDELEQVRKRLKF
jgi:hypothetical protein